MRKFMWCIYLLDILNRWPIICQRGYEKHCELHKCPVNSDLLPATSQSQNLSSVEAPNWAYLSHSTFASSASKLCCKWCFVGINWNDPCTWIIDFTEEANGLTLVILWTNKTAAASNFNVTENYRQEEESKIRLYYHISMPCLKSTVFFFKLTSTCPTTLYLQVLVWLAKRY